MKEEPLWKTVLNWGAVILFLTLPLIIMTIQLYILLSPKWMPEAAKYREHFKYLGDFLRNLAVLVFGLSGLRTWETVKQNGKHHEEDNKQQ
jgi:ABC-type transport system involved in cytochrome bd biosynthesis fused ATPase/permease subunit